MTTALDCSSNEVYSKITKKTGNWASEESFKIYAGGALAYSSPSLVNNQERVLEVCLSSATNNQYTIEMKDSLNDSWTNGAWIKIEGINGNVVYMAMMTEKTTQTEQFSLYSPINKGDTWKYNSNASGNWKEVSYSDSNWSEVTTGTTTQSATGTQYFRKLFTGVDNMAAIEIQLKYQYGIVTYLNGAEVYRDNMADGEPVSSTLASGSYTSCEYRGVIRPGHEVSVSSVLAVEVHFTESSHEETIQFNGFVSLLAGITSTNKCFVHYDVSTSTYSGFTNPDYSISWTRNTGSSLSSPPGSITYEFTGSVKPLINSFRIWAYTSPLVSPSSFTLEGAMSTSSTWQSIASVSDAVYTSYQWKQWDMVVASPKYPLMKFTAQSSQSSTISLYELQFLICNHPLPTTIDYPETQYSFLRYYDEVKIAPTSFGYSGCTITPSLPSGVSIDSNTCIISGTSTEVSAATLYQITSQIGTNQITASINIAFTECAGTYYKILRTYKTSPQNEFFRIRDTSNDNILFEVQSGHSHTAGEDWITYLCITVDRFDVTFDSTSTYWYSGSYYYMYSLLPDGEEEMVLKGRYDANQNNESTSYLRRPVINHSEQWYYKMGEVPTNWHSSETSGWSQGSRGSYSASSNRIQLYKKTFSINSLSEVSGLILSIRYKYGVIVYLNGNEAWRNGVTGDLSISSIVDNSYPDVKYYVVTLPGKQVQTSTVTTPVTFLQAGSNTIAIAIVAISDTQTTSYFDAVVRLMAPYSESHIWEYTGTISGMSGTATYPFDMYFGNSISSSSCTNTNYITITLNNYRREWISSVQIQNYYSGSLSIQKATQFKLYGRNSDTDTWTLLKDVTGITYSTMGQKRKIYLNNNTPYNQFKFENFGSGDSSACTWYIQSLDLFADDLFAEIPNFIYDSSVAVYKGIEMAEVIPENADGYFNFQVSPAFPDGIVVDPHSGWISGTASAESPATTYTITATKVSGGTVTATISLSVIICTGDRGLLTVRLRADSFPHENSWKLYQGKGTSGTVLQSVSIFPVKSAYYYVDFCLNDGIYTFQAADSYGDGWSTGTGYTLTVDQGEMELDIMEINKGTKPIYVSTVFSTYFPFQIEYTDWKVYQSSTEVSSEWNSVSFDDSTWNTYKAANIPATSAVTTYIRKSFSISGVSDYQVLNVRVKYAGGVAAYLNGNLVCLLYTSPSPRD